MKTPRIAVLSLGLTLACGESLIEVIPGEVARVAISPAYDTLAALHDSLQLSVTAYDGTGAVLEGASFTWSSDNESVASVNDQGWVTAGGNGVTTVRAAAGEVAGGAVITVSQRTATLEVASGDQQGGTVGMPLDSALVVTALDALGSPVAGAPVRFETTAGAADPVQVHADSTGHAATRWTLGVVAGTQELKAWAGAAPAPVVLTASAFAEPPDTMYLESGDQQTELASLPLPHPIRIKVLDRYGNGVPDVPIAFAVSAGSLDNGADTLQVPTDLDGFAAAQWTLSASLGSVTGRAVLPDSSVGDNLGLPGSPISFSATAVAFLLEGVSPGAPVVGQEMTIRGRGFDPDPGNNTVLVGGVAATVTGGTQSSLTVTVPGFGCTPAQPRTVSVTRGAEAGSTSVTVNPAGALALPVGGRAVVSDPAAYCLQFLSTANSAEEYLVGLTATRRLAGELSFALVGDDGVNPPPAPPAPAATSAAAFTVTPPAREMTLRAWEEDFFARHQVRPAPRLARPARAAVAPLVGQAVSLRIPNVSTDACNAYTPVTATVVAVGPRATVVTDAPLPADSVSVATITAAVQEFMATFGDAIYQVATAYFGLPSDLDQNQGITLLLSNMVTQMGLPSFTSAVDLLDPALCPASNGGEVIYLGIPAAPSAGDVTALLQAAPPGVAHDLAHLIQLSRRILAGGVPLAAWLGEGQAELATELVGMALRGDASRRDYGPDVVGADPSALAFYRPRFDRLSYLFGWDGSAGTVAGAPERCSLFGFGGVSVPCAPAYVPGVSWSFVRYVSDRLGAAFQGGDAGLQQALIGLDPAHDGTALLETLAGEDLAGLMVDWAMTLYTDGRVSPAEARTLQLPSWNLTSVFGALPAVQRLTPPGFGFASFSRAGSVVGGGTAYTLVGAGGAHGALALRVADPLGADLGAALEPRLWVVRVK